MSFFAGVAALFEGLRFMAARAALWPWIVVPALLMAVGIGGVAWWVWTWTPAAFAAILPAPDGGLLFGLYWGLVGYVMLVLFAAGAVVAWAASTLLATPFYDVLAERVEAELIQREAPPLTVQVALGDAARSIAHTLLAGLLFGIGSGVLGLLALVPVLDVLVPFAELALTALFVARELLDFPLSRRRLAFQDKLAFLWAHLGPFAGLGAIATALLWVPVLNLVVMPAAVVGATLLVVRLEHAGPPGPS